MTPTRNTQRPAQTPAQTPTQRRAKRPTSSSRTANGSAHSTAAAPQPSDAGGRRIQVRRSGVHGKGVFALRPIARGETVIEYVGKIMTWKQAQRLPPHNPAEPNHTFFFHLNDKHVIDATTGGNAARWINHACAPNCEADDVDGRIFIKALRNIRPGEELNYDYGLVIEERYTPQLKKDYACRCGARTCRGTMLAPKR